MKGPYRDALREARPVDELLHLGFEIRRRHVSTNTDVLGWLFERACGVSYAKLLHQHVWAPMGAQDDAYITLAPAGPRGLPVASVRPCVIWLVSAR